MVVVRLGFRIRRPMISDDQDCIPESLCEVFNSWEREPQPSRTKQVGRCFSSIQFSVPPTAPRRHDWPMTAGFHGSHAYLKGKSSSDCLGPE